MHRATPGISFQFFYFYAYYTAGTTVLLLRNLDSKAAENLELLRNLDSKAAENLDSKSLLINPKMAFTLKRK